MERDGVFRGRFFGETMNPGSGRPIYRAQAPRRRRESSVASSSSGSFHPSSFSNEHAACQDHIPDKGFDYQDAGHDKSHADEHEQAGDHRDLSLSRRAVKPLNLFTGI